MGRRATAFLLALVACGPRLAAGHGMRSAYLEVSELPGDRAAMRLSTNVPSSGLRVLPPEGCRAEGDSRADTALLLVECKGGLEGRVLRVEGIGPIASEVVVRVTWAGGTTSSRVLTLAEPAWRLPRTTRSVAVLGDYARMGVLHIVSGVDHLLFLAALAIALRRLRAILVAESAFTVSHTLTFTASALGWIHVSSAAAEACIALSLVLIALDAASPGDGDSRERPTPRAASLAFAFGLVHGLGFAGGLAEIGLPDRAIGWALVGFAAGVETGQVIFLVAFVALLALLSRAPRLSRIPLALAYGVGAGGVFLFLERISAIVHSSRGGL